MKPLKRIRQDKHRSVSVLLALLAAVPSMFVLTTRDDWQMLVALLGFVPVSMEARWFWRRRAQQPTANALTRGATTLAARLAGQRRQMLNPWLADLAGDPDSGVVLQRRQRAAMAAGFLWAALRMRAHDLFGWMWAPLDWVLRTDSRTHGFIASVVGGQALYIVGDGGLEALVIEVWEPCAILGAGLFVLSRWLRRVRGIELESSKPTAE